jgi:hypothetical protein
MSDITTIGFDLAKHVFQVYGVGGNGATVLRKQLRRGQVLAFFRGLPCCLVGMEASAPAHYWARELRALGHEVRLGQRCEVAGVIAAASPIRFSHIADDRLLSVIYMHMLDADKLLTATTHAAENFHLHCISLH